MRYQRSQSAGFTLIELLVVITVIAILASIVMPAIGMVRASAQKAKCLSNLRQIGVAHLGYTQDHRGLLPPWVVKDDGYNWAHFWLCLVANYGELIRLPEGHSRMDHNLDVVANSIVVCPTVPKTRYAFDPWGSCVTGFGINMAIRMDVYMKQYPLGNSSLHANWAMPLLKMPKPSDTMLVMDAPFPGMWADMFTADPITTDPIGNRHRNSANYLFSDFRAQSIAYSEVLPTNPGDVGTSQRFDSVWALKK
jgi:prepilin-type N-terminal cleavage/methylation domain-containing protein